MSIFTNIKLKLRDMIFGELGDWLRWPLGTDKTYRKVNPSDANIVMAPVQWGMRQIIESPLVASRDGEELKNHAAIEQWENPNDFYSGTAMEMAILMSLWIDGNAYIVKIRGGTTRIQSLWFVPFWLIEPWSERSNVLTEYYRYRYAPEWEIDPDDVIHIRWGIDPQNMRKGLSPLKTALREIYTDEEAADFTASVLSNSGMPGVVISPEGDRPIPDRDVKLMREYFEDRFGGRGRGKPFVVGAKTKIETLQWEPQKMALTETRNLSEERVCSLLGIPAAVVGFGTGIQQTKVGAPQPLTATLWTPEGPITMGDAEVGQTIAVPGGWEEIEGVYPQGEQDIYRITFQDGSTAESTIDHLWTVTTPNIGEQTLPLGEIAKFPYWKLKRAFVPEQKTIHFEKRDVMIPPYIMGILLGDGTFRHHLCLSNTSGEIIEYVKKELPVGLELRHKSRGDWSIRNKSCGGGVPHPLVEELKRLGLWMKYSRDKFVPDDYKYNSSEVRRELLQGLLDSDGYVSHNGFPAIDQTSKRLAEDIVFLVQSLGGYVLSTEKKVNTAERTIAGRPMRSRYNRIHQSIVVESSEDYFRVSTKRKKAISRLKRPTRKFRSIEWVRREEAQCIRIAGGHYLTDGFIVTHNTMAELRRLAYENAIIPTQRIIIEELNRSYLTEYETTGAVELGFDHSNVRVLQEDEESKIQRLNAAVQGGWLTVSQAQGLAGYEVDETQNVYLRKMAVAEVPSGTKQATDSYVHALKQEDNIYNRFYEASRKERERLEGSFATGLQSRFDQFGELVSEEFKLMIEDRGIAARSAETKQDDMELEIIGEIAVDRAIEDMPRAQVLAYGGHYLTVAESTVNSLNTFFGLGVELDDQVEMNLINVARDREHLIDLSKQSKTAVTQAIRAGREEGEGVYRISERVKQKVSAGPWTTSEIRGRVIARTETKWAQNQATHEAGRQTGAQYYRVIDAQIPADRPHTDSCGYVCSGIDGQIVDESSMDHLISCEHPNGTRSFVPVFGDEYADQAQKPLPQM